jgi:carboxylesterase
VLGQGLPAPDGAEQAALLPVRTSAPAPGGRARFDKSPLSLAGDARGVLCLHGFTGTPFEVRPLAEAFGRVGATVEVPVLAGHGSTLAALAASRWTDWLASAERALDGLQARVGGRPVALCGFSMGGLLALRLARLHPERVAALVVMCTPLRLNRWSVALVRAVGALPLPWARMPAAGVRKPNGSDISIPEMRHGNPVLPAFPLAALEQLFGLMDVARADLPLVRAPALVVDAAHDHVVPARDPREIAATLGSPIVERLTLERSFHVVALDVDAPALLDGVTRFVTRFLPE